MKRILFLSLFSLTMAFFEAAIVVYLREIIYPGGFDFPLRPFPTHLLQTEVIREAASILMLLSVALLFAKTLRERIAAFIFAFALWDLGYYLFLKLILDWPASLLSWDILFLIPAPWTGPVIAPIINSFTMILMAGILLSHKGKSKPWKSPGFWLPVVLGCIITIVAYLFPWIKHMGEEYSFWQVLTFSEEVLFSSHAQSFVPESFSYLMFAAGEFLFLLAIAKLWKG